jgi:mitogen-activated protein kinase-activated protein kinase 5
LGSGLAVSGNVKKNFLITKNIVGIKTKFLPLKSDLVTPQFTPYYASPQVLEAQKRYKRDKAYTYSKSCDMWSLGVIIYILLCGYPPFYPSQPNRKGIDKTMKKRIQNAEFEFPTDEWTMVSDKAKELISG